GATSGNTETTGSTETTEGKPGRVYSKRPWSPRSNQGKSEDLRLFRLFSVVSVVSVLSVVSVFPLESQAALRPFAFSSCCAAKFQSRSLSKTAVTNFGRSFW